jgi:serine/threonine kinase 38
MRQGRKKMTIREFEPLTIIGRGAFGEVRVCRQISTGDIVAIKKMRKEDMLNKNQLMHVRTEREIMTSSNEWIVNLKYSFQDEYYLYLVMDFLPGGDLMNLLMKKEILSEEEARFYTAEMILAVDSVHKLNCIHRDLKPDNILIDKKGHIQLSDFGLSKLSDKAFYPMSVKDQPSKPKKLLNSGNDSITTANSNMSNLNNSIKNTNKKAYKKIDF